jgi:hypothetical protein
MKIIIALEDLIEKNEKRAKIFRRQLSDHELGENQLSRVVKASTESSLDLAGNRLNKYKELLDDYTRYTNYEQKDIDHIKDLIVRKKFRDNQSVKSKKLIVEPIDRKLDVISVIDEAPCGIVLDDSKLFDIASKSLTLNEDEAKELFDKFIDIKDNFEKMTKDIKEEHITNLGSINTQIPILVFHLYILYTNLQALNSDKETIFKGFPKYEDWWISELWSSHQAYFALYKWRDIIASQCKIKEQKNSWYNIFDIWLKIKQSLNNKKIQGFQLQFAFDTLLSKYCELEEELVEKNLISMETIIKRITSKEDFTSVKDDHSVVTSYLQYKIKRLKENTFSDESLKDQ